MTDPIQRLAEHVMAARWQDLSEGAVNAAKTFVLDSLGVCVSGTAAPFADRAQAAVARWGGGDEATAIGIGMRLPAPSAALLNALHMHNQEFDCVHEPAVVHPMTTILSSSLAVAERRGGISGRDLILALTLGVDVATTIGMAARSPLKFFRPATAGVFGVAAAAARIEKLGRGALIDAFGLAYCQAAGSMQAHDEGKPTLALQIGMAARAGINAVDLAAAGFPAPHQVLEGPFGYFPLMEGDWEIEPAFSELGKVWRIAQISHKPFPSGRATHAGIDGIQRLLRRGDLAAAAVGRVTLIAPPLIHQLVGRPYRPDMEATYARLSFPYVGAVTLVKGTVAVDDFAPASLADGAIADLAARIEVVVDDNPDQNALAPQTVRVQLKCGEVREERVEDMIGSPHNPLTREQHLAKFRRCWRSGVRPLDPASGERLIGLIDRLDDLSDIGEIIELVA